MINSLSLTGLSLLYVGVVLCINGLSALGKIDKKEIVFVNSFVGIISFIVAFNLAFSLGANAHTVRAGALTFLFSCTYLWVAFSQHRGAEDERGLGWYCLFVSITAVPVTLSTLFFAQSLWEFWFAVCWGMWAVLWFSYFLNIIFLKISRKNIGRLSLLTGVITAWVPGYMLLFNYLR